MITVLVCAAVLAGLVVLTERRLARSQRDLDARMEERSRLMFKQNKELARQLAQQKKTADRILVQAYETNSEVQTVLLDPKVQRVLNRHEGS